MRARFMCRVPVFEFFIENVDKWEFEGRRVLEVGSKYINGSIRPFIERFLKPAEYIGTDIEPGKFVDVVMPAEKLLNYFGPEAFDVVICTETLEHIPDWRSAINNLKGVLKNNGYLYITTVERGFPIHNYPYDFWRYEVEDMKEIFRDFEIMVLRADHKSRGIFLKAKKPKNYVPADLSTIALYSIILGRRTKDIPNFKEIPLIRRIALELLRSKISC
jgi:SAM-dependent methyltransferase